MNLPYEHWQNSRRAYQLTDQPVNGGLVFTFRFAYDTTHFAASFSFANLP
jgi:hypothetical protein